MLVVLDITNAARIKRIDSVMTDGCKSDDGRKVLFAPGKLCYYFRLLTESVSFQNITTRTDTGYQNDVSIIFVLLCILYYFIVLLLKNSVYHIYHIYY